MIVRMSEAAVNPGMLEEFREIIVAAVAEFPGQHEGLLSHEVVSDDERTLIYLSRWRDEAALEAYAGPGWRDQPVMLPDEERFLAEPLRVRHFAVDSTWPTG
jgi:hypothetical protein